MDLASYGDLAVRLVGSGHPDRPREDALVDVAGVVALLPEGSRWRTRVGPSDVAALRALRERLRAVFLRAAAGRHAEAVELLNALLAGTAVRPRVTGHDGRPWHLHLDDGAGRAAHAYAAGAVMGLAVQLTEEGIERLGTCAAASCPGVFVDTSTNRSRRYCSERCATRANVAAHRARRRAAG